MRPRLAAALILAAALGLPGCSAIRFGGGGPLAGSWTGTLLIEGQSIASTLVVEGDSEVEATLSAPSLRLDASGDGSVRGSRVTLALSYELTCPGVMTLTGELEAGGRLSGRLEARDCTGAVSGSFAFLPGRG